MRILLVEPWYGGSHRAWADGLVAHSRHDITLVTHEDRFWRWRLRGSAVTLAAEIARHVDAHGPPDLLLVSGMTDLAQLVGIARRSVAGVPVALYRHESQLLHPPSPNGGHGSQPSWTEWASLCAADHVFCNSNFHRDAMLSALPGLLAAAPDRSPRSALAEVAARTTVLPVGVEVDDLIGARRASRFDHGEPPLVVWNQRWDHDKDPGALLRVLRALARDGSAFRVAFAGENRRVDPREFDRAADELGDRVVHTGHLDRRAYLDLLLAGDVVVSTARHEFFGVAVVEAVAAGLVPLLPHRLSYPELVPGRWHDAVLYRSRLYDHLGAVLGDLPAARRGVVGLRESMARFGWSRLAPVYDDALAAVAAGREVPSPC